MTCSTLRISSCWPSLPSACFWTASHCRFDTREELLQRWYERQEGQKVVVVDTDASHYPYSDELLIGGMNCDGCAQNVANALNALDGVWATVTYADHTARVRSKQPVDRGVLETAVKDAGYYVMTL